MHQKWVIKSYANKNCMSKYIKYIQILGKSFNIFEDAHKLKNIIILLVWNKLFKLILIIS